MEGKETPVETEHALTPRDRSQAISALVEEHQGWWERKLKPKKITARYPFKGKPLLWATCGFGSLGDALFGYNSGMANETGWLECILILQASCLAYW